MPNAWRDIGGIPDVAARPSDGTRTGRRSHESSPSELPERKCWMSPVSAWNATNCERCTV